MVNPFIEVNWRPDRVEKRKFARTLMLGIPAAAAGWYIASRLVFGDWKEVWIWVGAAGFLLGLGLWLAPALARPVYVAWNFVGCCLGFVGANTVLSLFYYMVITPVGLLMRILGRVFLTKGFDKTKTSYWQDAEKGVDLRRYYRQF